jgi:hypothetical protein
MTAMHESSLHRREAEFHDEWVLTTPLDQILVRECFEALAAVENRFILRQMGSLRKILDIGAGLDESSVYSYFKARLLRPSMSPHE